MKIEKQIDINAGADEVWNVIGPGFPDAYKWASGVDASQAAGGDSSFPGAPCSGRACETSIGSVRENVLVYDEDAHRISYEAFSDKMPGFVKRLVASWRFSNGAGGSTRVHMSLTVEISPPFNVLMGPMMRLQMSGLLSTVMKDLKHYVETGQPSAAKRRARAKFEKKTAA